MLLVRTLRNNFKSSSLNVVFYRCMSVYPSHYMEPIPSKNKQVKLRNSYEFEKFAHMPTKAAKNDESSSIFCNDLVTKMINYITRGGNKRLARDLLERTFECVKRMQIERLNLVPDSDKEKIIADPEQLMIMAIENSRPLLQLTAIKRGGVNYQVPVPVTQKRSYFLAMKWLLEAAREKERKVHLPEKLAWELLDAAYGMGRVIKKKNDLHRQCEGNRAYAHYRWS